MSVIVDETAQSDRSEAPGVDVPESGGPHETDPSPSPEPRYRLPWPMQLAFMLTLGLGIGGYLVHRHDKAAIPVAAVNGYVISKRTLDDSLEQAGGVATMTSLVKDELGLQFAKRLGVLPTQAEVDRRYQELIASPGAAQLLTSTGQSKAQVEHHLLLQLAVVNVTRLGVNVTPADVKRYYDENIDPANPAAQYYTPPSVDLSVIETKSKKDIQLAEQALLAQQSFADVAFKYSQDPTRLHGGQVPGPIYLGRSYMSKIPGLEKAVFSLNVGQVYGPAYFSGDWWIIQCNDRTDAQVQPFDSVKDDCEDGAVLSAPPTARSREIKAQFDKFVKQSKIRAFDHQYDSAVQIAP